MVLTIPQEQAESISPKTDRKKHMPKDAFAKRRMLFLTKTGVPKVSYSNKNPSASHILQYPQHVVPRGGKGTCSQALCPGTGGGFEQKRRAKSRESPKVMPSNQGGT